MPDEVHVAVQQLDAHGCISPSRAHSSLLSKQALHRTTRVYHDRCVLELNTYTLLLQPPLNPSEAWVGSAGPVLHGHPVGSRYRSGVASQPVPAGQQPFQPFEVHDHCVVQLEMLS